MRVKLFLRKLFQYFLQGVIIVAPIAITVWAVTVLFNSVDNILPSLINQLFPNLFGPDQPKKIPGLGFIVVILIVIGIGYISSSFIFSRMVELFDKLLERTPGIKIIYTTVKDFFEAFAGNKRKFNKAVLVSIDADDIWRVGFITSEDLHEFGLQEHMAVYVPSSYAVAGTLFFVKKERIRLLTDVSSADAMKFVISGGVTHIEDDETHLPSSEIKQKEMPV